MIFRPYRIKLGRCTDPAVASEVVELGVCADCNSEQWFVFLFGENYTPHVKCASCGAVYRVQGEDTTDPNDLPQRVMPGEVLRVANIPHSEN